jgi:hypothetical protein
VDSPGDDIATDAAREILEQTLPPTLDVATDQGPDMQTSWEKRVRECDPGQIDIVVRDAMENDGVDVRALAAERKKAIAFTADQKRQRKQTKLPGE